MPQLRPYTVQPAGAVRGVEIDKGMGSAGGNRRAAEHGGKGTVVQWIATGDTACNMPWRSKERRTATNSRALLTWGISDLG